MCFPGVLKENSGGGLLGFAGVDVTGFDSSSGLDPAGGKAAAATYSERLSEPAGRVLEVSE